MTAHSDRTTRIRATPMLALVVVTAVLYLAREVLIPLALAALISFLLVPAARRLEALRLGRTPSTLLALALFIGVIGAVGWIAGNELLSFAAKLPGYQDNISRKLEALRAPPKGDLGKAAK